MKVNSLPTKPCRAVKCGCHGLYQPEDFICPRCANKGYIEALLPDPRDPDWANYISIDDIKGGK